MKINAKDVKILREKTGVAMLDCKRALIEAEGDLDRSVTILREKGMAKLAKRASREAKEGIVYAYIHGAGKLGVLVEVNSETDFVSKNDDFINFVKDIALQVAASVPLYISRDEVPQKLIDQEIDIARKQLKLEGKPESIIDKIIPGKLDKYFSTICLLEQESVKYPGSTINDLFENLIVTIGEKLVIRRFVRYELGR